MSFSLLGKNDFSSCSKVTWVFSNKLATLLFYLSLQINSLYTTYTIIWLKDFLYSCISSCKSCYSGLSILIIFPFIFSPYISIPSWFVPVCGHFFQDLLCCLQWKVVEVYFYLPEPRLFPETILSITFSVCSSLAWSLARS